MKRFAVTAWALLGSLLFPWATSGVAQQVNLRSGDVIFRSSPTLVLVDVTALKNGLPDKSLKRDDFQLFDNGHPVSIKTFDSGAQSTTRPLALWFVVQCNMRGWSTEGSGFFAGQTRSFKPALRYLDKRDSMAVAHWCDNGAAQLDLLPTSNVDDAIAALENVLLPMPEATPTGRPGELALQKTLQLIVDETHSIVPEPVPVVIFLYGDHSGMPREEADHFIDELLETSAIAYGLKDRRSPGMWWLPGEQKEVAHYIATETGGQYLAVTPENYGAGLQEILRQLHFRYELGFKPEALDGKRHELRVTLVDAAKSAHKGMRLKSRAAYVPMPQGTR